MKLFSKVNIKDAFGLAILCFGLAATSSLSVVSSGTPLIDDIAESARSGPIFQNMVSEDEEPFFGKAELSGEIAIASSPAQVFEKILLSSNSTENEATDTESNKKETAETANKEIQKKEPNSTSKTSSDFDERTPSSETQDDTPSNSQATKNVVSS